MVTQLGSSPFHRVTLPGAWSLSLPLLFGASYQEKKRLSTFNTKFTCYSLSVIFFLLIRSKKYLVLKRNLLLSCHFYLPLPSLLGSVKRMSPTFWKKKAKTEKKTALYYYYYFRSLNLAKIVSRHLVPKNDLGEISLKRKKRKRSVLSTSLCLWKRMMQDDLLLVNKYLCVWPQEHSF